MPSKDSYAFPTIPLKHLSWMLITLAPYVFATVLPYSTLYEEGKYWPAVLLFELGGFCLNAGGYSLSSHFWIVKLLGLEWRWSNWRLTILPAVMSGVFLSGSRLLFDISGLWSLVPFVPSISGGVLYNAVQPFFCYLALPTEMKQEKGFLFKKYIWAIAPAFLIDMFWFATLGYYFAMSQTPEAYRILVVIAFRLFAVVYIGVGIRLIHAAVRRNGIDDDELVLGACGKFSIDAAFEVHLFFTLHDIESWMTMGLLIAFDYICLTVELLHHSESTLDAALDLLKFCYRKLSGTQPPPSPTTGTSITRVASISSKQVEVERVGGEKKEIEKTAEMTEHKQIDDGEGGELPGARLRAKRGGKSGNDVVAMSKSLASLAGKPLKPSRALHYCMAIHARLYATVIVSILLPIWFYGPNRTWYFDFSEHVMSGSILKIYIATGAAVIHCIIAFIILRHRMDVHLGKIWMELMKDAFMPLVIGYCLAPVFPTSQIGREWTTISYFRGLMVQHGGELH